MDLIYSTVSRITGGDELAAVDVSSEAGKNRLYTETLERLNSFRHQVVSVGTTPTILRGGVASLANRRTITIQNQGSSDIFIGDSNVSLLNGLVVYKKGSVTISISENQDVYAISDKVGVMVFVLEAT